MPAEVGGVDDVINLLKKWEAEVLANCATELENAANMLISKAQAPGRCRVDTGFMRDNIKIVEQTPTKITVGSLADYSIYNEEGTYKMSAQPFMFNSAMETEQEFIGKLGERVRAICSEGLKF